MVTMDTKAFKRLLKQLRVPASARIEPDDLADGSQCHVAVWTKRGGHAGSKVIRTVHCAAHQMGLVASTAISPHSPDGSRVGFDATVSKDGVRVSCLETYGETAADNRFSITVTAR
jgi:hypothetical protein